MTERPILFSAPMVRALLAGTKTQTRRAFSIRMIDLMYVAAHAGEVSNFIDEGRLAPNDHGDIVDFCPYGQPGDRLWVRESFAFTDRHEPEHDGSVDFRADGKCYAVSGNQLVDVPSLLDPYKGPWRPSIHMPRWASRILLEIVSVRVERLQDISEADAKAEGIEPHEVRQFMLFGASADERAAIYRDAAVGPYRGLWEQINGGGSWKANPWVWVVEFRRIEP